jgi:RsiW-degrading membrane proteinase PrsW (M82 family)
LCNRLNYFVWGLELFSTVVWGLVPPLAVLLLYYRRVRAAPSLSGLICLFGVGILAGFAALGLEWLVLITIKSVVAAGLLLPTGPRWLTDGWLDDRGSTAFVGLMLRQIGVIAPIEEGCKLAGVVLPLMLVIRRYRRLPAQPSTVLLATFAVAMGFAAQESSLAIWHNPSVIVNRTLGTPMHAIFSAPWGLTLGFALCRIIPTASGDDRIARPYKLTMQAWMTACLIHAGSNCWIYLTQAARMSWLVYPLFAWWLWLWWQTEGMLARSQGEPIPQLITATQRGGQIQEYVMAIAALGLGAAAINALRDFGNSVTLLWELRATFDPATAWFVGQELLQTLILGTIGLYLFRYLRRHR